MPEITADIAACMQKLRDYQVEPQTLIMDHGVFNLCKNKLPMKGNAKRRKAIRWTNRKRAHIREYFA